VGEAVLFTEDGTRFLKHDKAECAIVGTVFRRADNSRLTDLDAGSGYMIGASGGRALIDNFWGGYAAIIAMTANAGVQVVRDPSGTVPVYWLSRDGVVIVFSDLALLMKAGIAIPPFDWNGLAHHLRFPVLRGAATGLAGVRELMPGARLQLGSGAPICDQLWSPWQFVSKPAAPIAVAAKRLEHVVSASTIALASAYGKIQLELSGGLDSSILAACLSGRQEPWRCITFATQASDGDERSYARAAAELAQTELEELIIEVADADPLRDSDMRRLRPGGFAILGGADAMLLDSAFAAGVDAIFSGGGGDNVFCTINSAAPVVDAWHDMGWRAAWTALNNVALLNETTIWDAASHTLGQFQRRRGGRPLWPIDDQFLLLPGQVSFEGHPWLEAPGNAPLGKVAHVASLLRYFPYLDGYDRALWLPMICPLMSQPVMEACLAIPTWQWIDLGQNRAVARLAFSERISPKTRFRRTKGGLESLFVPAFLNSREGFRTLLANGQLAAHGIIDIHAIEDALDLGIRKRDGAYVRILQIADVELWIRSIERLRTLGR
jgi:asparagine synthase (glutamine-hydrolysing)